LSGLLLVTVSLAGFIAQLFDGTAGMGFGVVATSVLLLLAFNPALASAVVHLAEVVTSFISGVSHIKLGNVNWRTLTILGIPGGIGAFTGAVFLSNIDLSSAKPYVSSLLIVLGILILYQNIRIKENQVRRSPKARWLVPMGFFGGFFDSTGGGGWGPIITTSLSVSRALPPRLAIGTSNTTEFLIAVTASLGFLVGLGPASIPWDAVLALVVGGGLAAPIAAWLVSKTPQRILGVILANFVILLNVTQLALYFRVGVLGITSITLGSLALFAWTVTTVFLKFSRDKSFDI
jgi:uncharacterized protein